MPINRAFKFLFLCSLAVCGFWMGFSQPVLDSNRLEMSSEFQKQSINSYDHLPCPSPEKYKELAERIHLVMPEGSEKCDNSNKAILGKVLLLMESLKVNPPAEWLPGIQADLRNLLDYVAKNAAKVELDLSQFNTVAFNRSDLKEIYLGGYLFQAPPLEAISALIHEARHSVQTADHHVTCEMGDLPLRDNSCDQTFSVSEKDAGAYSYDILHQALLGLYGVGLLQSDREFLYSSALATLIGRINELPPELGKKEDVLITMNKQGQLFSVDTRNNQFYPIRLSFKDKEERPVRIEFSTRDSGVLIFTNKFHLYVWTYKDGLTPFNDTFFPKDLKIYDFSRGFLPWEGNRSRYFLKTGPHLYKTVQLLPSTLKMGLVDLEKPEKLQQYPEFKRLFMAMYGETVFLTEDGKLYLLTHDPYPEKLFNMTEGLQDSRGWRQGTGGVVYHDLFLLNNAGELKLAIAKYHEEIEGGLTYSTYTLKEKDFRIPGKAIKYFQGMKYHAQMNDIGEIYLRGYDSNRQVKIAGKDIVDFTIIHNPIFSSKIVPTYKLPKTQK